MGEVGREGRGKVGRGGEGKGGEREGKGAGEKGRGRSSPNVRDALTLLLLHLPYCEDCICSSFPWRKSKLH